MRADYAARYRDLAERHWWWRSRELLVLDEIDRLRPAAGWERVLDIGCGGGVLFDRLLERAGHVEGIEPDPDLVDPEGPHTHRIHVRPFDDTFRPDAPFGLVLMLDVLEHMDRRREALAHVARILDPGGVLVLTVPALPGLWTRHDDLNEHRLRYTRRSLRKEAAGTGLSIVELRYFFHWTVAGKLVQRILEAVRPGSPSPPRVPPRPVNELLAAASRLEQRVSRVARPPLGSSMLMVAERPLSPRSAPSA